MEEKQKDTSLDITITTINWNISFKLQECIDSFLNTYKDLDYEWFIFDNNSQDMDFYNIIHKYSEYKRIEFIKNDKNEGLAVLNKIINKAKGRYWVFLDPDTLQKGKPIKKLIEFMDYRTDTGMATAKQLNPNGTPLLYYNRNFNIAKIFFRQTIVGRFIDHFLLSDKMAKYHSYADLNINRIVQIDQTTFSCTIIRMDILKEDGYVIDPDLSFWYNDVDLCKRVRDKGYKIYIVPTAEIIHDHGSSYKKSKPLWQKMIRIKSQIKYFRKHHKHKLWILKLLINSEVLMMMIKNKIKRNNNKVLFWKFLKVLKW